MDSRVQLLAKNRDTLGRVQQKQAKTWELCRKCTGSDEFAKMCSNADCHRFFERHAVDQRVRRIKARVQLLLEEGSQ